MGASEEITEIIIKREKSPETTRLLEKRTELTKPGIERLRYDHYLQRRVWVPRRPDKRSREQIAEIDMQLLGRANRLGGGYASPRRDNGLEEISSNKESIIGHGTNFPIIDWRKYEITGKDIYYVQIGHTIGKTPANQEKVTEDRIKKAEFDFMLDLKSIIEKTATDPDLIKVRLCVRKRSKEQAHYDYKHGFEKISDRWGILFSDDRINIPSELRPKLLQTLHHGHAGSTKMLAEAKIFW